VSKTGVVTAISLGLLLVSCSPNADKAAKAVEMKPAGDRKSAPEFSLKDADGKTVTLADYKGKVVLLNFWATWCAPCKIEIPWFADFEQRFKDRGFAVVGVSLDEDGWEQVKPYIQANKINYRILMGTDVTAQLYGGVDSLPTTFLLDGDGKIAFTHVGLVSKGDYENEIVQLLDGVKRAAVDGGSASPN
jgi:peroxiredoxin